MQLPERLAASWEVRGYALLCRLVLTSRRTAETLVRSILWRPQHRHSRYQTEARLRVGDRLRPQVPLVRNRH